MIWKINFALLQRQPNRPAARHLAGEAVERFGLVHADHRIVVAAHAGIGLIRRALGQDLRIRRGHMAVRAADQRDAAIAEMAHRHLFRGRLAMNVDDGGVDARPHTVFLQFGIHGGEGIVQRVHEHPAATS